MFHRKINERKKYNFCYHNITFLYPLLTKKLYFEGGGASLYTFKKNKKVKNFEIVFSKKNNCFAFF